MAQMAQWREYTEFVSLSQRRACVGSVKAPPPPVSLPQQTTFLNLKFKFNPLTGPNGSNFFPRMLIISQSMQKNSIKGFTILASIYKLCVHKKATCLDVNCLFTPGSIFFMSVISDESFCSDGTF